MVVFVAFHVFVEVFVIISEAEWCNQENSEE